MRRFGLIGKTLHYSFSKDYFSKKFKEEHITDCVYELFPLAQIEDLASLLNSHTGWVGLNITIPYKHDVLAYATDLSNLPQGLLACNCLHFTNGAIVAHNTDVIGFEKSFVQAWQPQKHHQALVLGSGGAAKAVQYVLGKLGIPFQVVGRKTKPGTHITYAELGREHMATHQIIINTTPLGTFPNMDEKPPLPYLWLTPEHYLFDLVYNPPISAFLAEGQRAGATIKNGYDMLVLQAEESWRIWNSVS